MTTVCDVQHHQIIDILPSRHFVDMAGFLDRPTEALNNLIKPIGRMRFGFRNFHNCRIRALLNAGKPDSCVIGSSSCSDSPPPPESDERSKRVELRV